MEKNKIIAKKINLKNQVERETYSKKLQNFEKEFTYPLGNESFYINHGLEKDYFVFFEKLGKPNIMVLENNNEIIGLCCAILRNINGKNIWYICDFKIKKEFRGKKLYKKLMWKYFLSSYLKCQEAFAINMSSTVNNKLFFHTKKIFKIFNFKITEKYLHAFEGKYLKEFSKSFWENYVIVSNNGEKDIVINGKSQKLFHIVEKSYYKNNLKKYEKININKINESDKVMLLTGKSMHLSFAEETVISLFSKTKSLINISSAEI